ncbi:MAG: DEAD/DEAH box helicase, partial [Chthoniobacterales bacterium]
MSFWEYGLSDAVVHGVQALGFTDPTPIQVQSFPVILNGQDIIASAQTGTGKTAAFAMPLISILKHHSNTRCLILEPTRELALQVEEAFRDYSKFTDLKVAAIF